jgi:hypothetical protein
MLLLPAKRTAPLAAALLAACSSASYGLGGGLDFHSDQFSRDGLLH